MLHMLDKARTRISAPMLVAGVALAVAAGGPSLAGEAVAEAARLVTGKQVKNGSITGADIKDRSLTLADFRGSVGGQPSTGAGPAGPAGPGGPAGPAGTNGTAGATNAVVRRVTVAGQADAEVTCQAGERAVGGGYENTGLGTIAESTPVPQTADATPTGWQVTFSGVSSGTVYAVCVSP